MAQLLHEVDAAVEYMPASQTMHAERPVVEPKVPAAQTVQVGLLKEEV